MPADLKVADVPLIRSEHLFGEGYLGHKVQSLAVFGGLVIFELVLDWLKVVDGLFFSVELGRDLLLEDGGEHPA